MALVIAAVQVTTTRLTTGELLTTVLPAESLLAGLAAVTVRGENLLAVLARSYMTEFLAGVAPAGENFAARFTTQELSVAPGQSTQRATGTSLTEGGLARVTRPRVAEVQTGVRTLTTRAQWPAAHLTTAVRHQALIPVPLRADQLPTEAAVLPGQGLHHHLAPRAPPARLLGG